jgi:hypothetical protein
MPTSNRLVFHHWSKSNSVTTRTAVYGPVRTVVWQGSVGDHRPYADQVGLTDTEGSERNWSCRSASLGEPCLPWIDAGQIQSM